MLRNFDTEAELIKLSFENMLVRWGSNTPVRTGLHASSVLVKDEEWCVRRHVLAELFPDQAVAPEIQPWDWKQQEVFLHGWEIHRMLQTILRGFARVAYDKWNRLELDLTHYDETRNISFSPDAILDFARDRYVMEIKGVKQESFQELTDDLQVAMESCETVYKAVHQANLYCHLLELKKAIILIWNKNMPDFKLWVIQYNAKMSVKYVQRIYDVKGQVTLTRMHGTHRLPARICASRGDALARKCPMKDCCFSEKMEGK